MDSRIINREYEKVFTVYKDVIFAVTQGRFNLIKHEEKIPITSEGILISEVKISKKEDVARARQAVKDLCKEENLLQNGLMHILLCISEAATNIIKHANRGTMQIRRLRSGIRVIFEDQGSGMKFSNLPNMIFLKGYSTKYSLGYGFSIIYKFSNKVYLATDNSGTLLALDFKLI